MKTPTILLLLCVLSCSDSFASRKSDYHTLGWYNTFATIHTTGGHSLWLEYQWRRTGAITSWQQSLFRTGWQYHVRDHFSVMAGYGYIITHPYSTYMAVPHPQPEHRIFQQLSWNDSKGSLILNHRIRMEQRYLGTIRPDIHEYRLTGWNYANRVRYQLRATAPLNRKKIEDKTLYLAVLDEIFIGFGRHVNRNIFDQNRIGLFWGYQFNASFRAEAGYFNQTVQQAAMVDGQDVFQYNNGFMLNVFLTRQ